MNKTSKIITLYIFIIGMLIGTACDSSQNESSESKRISVQNQTSMNDVNAMNSDHDHSKTDISDQRIPYITCNSGDLIIEELDNEYIATVTATDIVDYFIEESQKSVESTVEYSNESTTTYVQKKLPWMSTVIENTDGSRKLVIRDFRIYDNGDRFATSGPPGSRLTRLDNGYKLELNGSASTSSHTTTYYKVADWYFDSCTLDSVFEEDQIESDTVVEDHSIVASCNDASFVIEHSKTIEGNFIATISDVHVIDYILSESEDVYCEEVEYSRESRTACVQKKLPWMATIDTTNDGSFIMVIRDFRIVNDGESYSTSGPANTQIIIKQEGVELTIRGAEATSSHSLTYYEVAKWHFESCNFFE